VQGQQFQGNRGLAVLHGVIIVAVGFEFEHVGDVGADQYHGSTGDSSGAFSDGEGSLAGAYIKQFKFRMAVEAVDGMVYVCFGDDEGRALGF